MTNKKKSPNEMEESTKNDGEIIEICKKSVIPHFSHLQYTTEIYSFQWFFAKIHLPTSVNFVQNQVYPFGYLYDFVNYANLHPKIC